jgi:hypothetical protein
MKVLSRATLQDLRSLREGMLEPELVAVGADAARFAALHAAWAEEPARVEGLSSVLSKTVCHVLHVRVLLSGCF